MASTSQAGPSRPPEEACYVCGRDSYQLSRRRPSQRLLSVEADRIVVPQDENALEGRIVLPVYLCTSHYSQNVRLLKQQAPQQLAALETAVTAQHEQLAQARAQPARTTRASQADPAAAAARHQQMLQQQQQVQEQRLEQQQAPKRGFFEAIAAKARGLSKAEKVARVQAQLRSDLVGLEHVAAGRPEGNAWLEAEDEAEVELQARQG